MPTFASLPCSAVLLSHLGEGLHGAYVGVGPEQNVLQLSLLLVDALHRQTLVILLGFGDGLVLKQGLQRDGACACVCDFGRWCVIGER